MLPHLDKKKFCLKKSNLKLFFQLLSKRAQLFQALTQVHMTVEFNKGLDEVRNTPFGFHLIPAEMKEKLSWILSSKMAKTSYRRLWFAKTHYLSTCVLSDFSTVTRSDEVVLSSLYYSTGNNSETDWLKFSGDYMQNCCNTYV